MIKKWGRSISLLAITAVFLTACGTTNSQSNVKTKNNATKPVQSQKINSQKPTLIYFMASWCPSCVSEEGIFR